jgi:hypothetical protein
VGDWFCFHQQTLPVLLSAADALAGAMVQKVVNYGMGLAIVGSISPVALQSSPLRTYIQESNAEKAAGQVADEPAFSKRSNTLPLEEEDRCRKSG